MTGTGHCDTHEGNLRRISEVEASNRALCERTTTHTEQIADIYDKWNDMTSIHAQIMGKLGSMETKQDTMLTKIIGLCTQFTKHVEEEEKRDEQVQKAIDEINRFAWFRNRMNSLRDNLPGIIFYGVLVIIGLLIVASDIKIKDLLKRFTG